jgi:hypothetical protein
MKNWGGSHIQERLDESLQHRFRHPLNKHCRVFHAVVNIVQSQLQHRPTSQVRYNDRINK